MKGFLSKTRFLMYLDRKERKKELFRNCGFRHEIEENAGRKFPFMLLGKKSMEGRFDRKFGVSGKTNAFYKEICVRIFLPVSGFEPTTSCSVKSSQTTSFPQYGSH